MTTRRAFMKIAGASVATLAYRRSRSNNPSTSIKRSFEHGQPLREFDYDEIFLHPGLQASQLEQTHTILMGMNEESLLRPYRLRVGLPAPGCDLGGWYSSDEGGGETFGQWISALSRYYATTQDGATRDKVDRLVRAFALTIEPSGKIYGQTSQTGGCAYHYDKLVCGLMDAHQFARHPTALEVLARATEAVMPHLPGKAVDFRVDTNFSVVDNGAHESYTLPENQFISWQRGGSLQHLTMAHQYLDHAFFDPLARGENVLPGRHAYSHVNALCSAVKAYLVSGEERYFQAAKNGFGFVEAQSYATGGWGPNEFFVPSAGLPSVGAGPIASLNDSLTHTHRSFETPCGAYAHFKLTRYLLRLTKQSSYGDSMERVMYNTVLGAKELQKNGLAFYYSDYHHEGRKTYLDTGGYGSAEWPCCSGTLTQIATDYRISTYFADAGGVYVNLFIPSTLRWQQNGTRCAVTQTGSYPLGDVVSMTIETAVPRTFLLRLRIPAWAKEPSIRINGSKIGLACEPGTFAAIKREWRTGDRVELELPRTIELKAIDSAHPDTVAVVSGPLVLFAVCDETPTVTRQQLLAADRKDKEGVEWYVQTGEGRLRLTPFWIIQGERYSTYLTVT